MAEGRMTPESEPTESAMAPTHEWTADATPAGALPLVERATFLKRTYGHLLGAIMAFVILELVLFRVGFSEAFARAIMAGPKMWLLVLGGFMLVGVVANRYAASPTSRQAQYMGLSLYVLIEGLMFAPLLWMADTIAPGAILSAGWITALGFSGLTAVVLLGKGDFSFMGSALRWIGVVAMITIAASFFLPITLGLWFSVAMVALAGGFILYTTSNVLYHYPPRLMSRPRSRSSRRSP